VRGRLGNYSRRQREARREFSFSKESSSFLKKRTKKLVFISLTQYSECLIKVFWCFFSKKNCLLPSRSKPEQAPAQGRMLRGRTVGQLPGRARRLWCHGGTIITATCHTRALRLPILAPIRAIEPGFVILAVILDAAHGETPKRKAARPP
jgi:hypothetical protein